FHPIGGELFLDREGLVASAPAPFLVDPSAQGVHHSVQIRTDPESEESDVITGVTDDCDGIACALPFGVRGTDPQSGFGTSQETCSADTTGRYDYPMRPSLAGWGRVWTVCPTIGRHPSV